MGLFMRIIKLIILCLVFVGISACGDDAPTLSRLPADAVILAFGDSLTEGVGAKDQESYPAVLQELTGRKVINGGVSGEESAPGFKTITGIPGKT